MVPMPTRQQLQDAGQHDLVRHINEAGGFLEVRARLGPPLKCGGVGRRRQCVAVRRVAYSVW